MTSIVMNMKRLVSLMLFISPFSCFPWGFFAHKEINRLAVFALPPEMFGFYKKNIDYISDNAVNPDKRRYAVKEEACRHFIDLDAYDDSIKFRMPKYWKDAVKVFSEDTLFIHGIVPWHIYLMKHSLTEAFKNGNTRQILKLSAEIGHYIADANVPLHTTRNYNGQFTNQHGIHGFWESRLPELYSKDYNFFTGRCMYVYDVQDAVWKGIYNAHRALDSVLIFEQELNKSFAQEKKYSFEDRNGTVLKVYSREYAEAYHKKLCGQVERQMYASVKLLSDIWYTCWIDAGQPDLMNTDQHTVSESEPKIQGEQECTH
jgi:hypothetical protein